VPISIQNGHECARFCAGVLADPGLPAQAGWRNNTERIANHAAVDAHLGAAFLRPTRLAASAARLAARDRPAGRVPSLGEHGAAIRAEFAALLRQACARVSNA
jgi:itaconate CoA-transferase